MKYKVGLIGLGRIASLLEDDPLRSKPASHAGAFMACRKTDIVSACDINPDRLKVFGERWGIGRLYDNHQTMLKKENLDIVGVSTWTETHAKIVVDSAESGVRGIYCEKPIALNLTQARRMLRACRKNGAALVVGHERRWDIRYRTIRDMLLTGKLGQLKSITGYTLCGKPPPRLSRRRFGGGAMFHDGTHLVDLFRFFGGEIESVAAFENRPDGDRYIENMVTGVLRFKNGCTGLILSGGERGYFHFEIDIQTDSARVILGNHTSKLYTAKLSGQFTGFHELARAPFPETYKAPNHFVGGVNDLVHEMETGEKSISSGEDAYKALEIIMALYKSAGARGSIVKLPL